MTTTRPLRADAARNRERLVLAARDVFRRKGLDAPLEEIARQAGVAIGTLYNRFGSRGELADEALGPLARRAVQLAERAAGAEDPWQGFAMYVAGTCALFAEDKGFAGIYRTRLPGTPVIAAAQERLAGLKDAIMSRAKHAGVLRPDVTSTDIALITWGIAAIIDSTRHVAPDAWRRHLALVLDGLRPDAASPLPGPALTPQQLRDAEAP